MSPRRTNLALLVVLVAALASGGLAFAGATRLAGLAGARRRFTGSLPVAAAGLADPRGSR
jgi:hypothetical protein